MAIINKCANCGATIVFGKQTGDNQYCNDICRENHQKPGFCGDCVAETTDVSPGGTFTYNGIGTKLYGNDAKCPQCASVIKRKWFCILFIPVIPLKKFRIKQVTARRYLGRFLPPEHARRSQLRAAGGQS